MRLTPASDAEALQLGDRGLWEVAGQRDLMVAADNARFLPAHEILSRHFRAVWGAEGPLADVIIEAIEDHTGTHLAELRAATG